MYISHGEAHPLPHFWGGEEGGHRIPKIGTKNSRKDLTTNCWKASLKKTALQSGEGRQRKRKGVPVGENQPDNESREIAC